MQDGAGVLILAGAPIGDPGDVGLRVRAALQAADIVAAEDTRRLRRLLHDLDVRTTGRVVSCYDAVEAQRAGELAAAAAGGATVLLVTDAGMPVVSDPGYRVVRAAVDAGVRVTCVPGPSAVTAALAVSGLASDRFCFEGFLPRKAGERRRALAELAAERRTLVFFEAPHRLAATLTDLATVFGADRPAVVCRELTKTYEEVRRDGLAALATWAAQGVRGEVTLVVAGADLPPPVTDPVELAARVSAYEQAGGQSRKEAIAQVAADTGARRRDVFDAVVAARKPGGHAI